MRYIILEESSPEISYARRWITAHYHTFWNVYRVFKGSSQTELGLGGMLYCFGTLDLIIAHYDYPLDLLIRVRMGVFAFPVRDVQVYKRRVKSPRD
jgi:hypothetical protein